MNELQEERQQCYRKPPKRQDVLNFLERLRGVVDLDTTYENSEVVEECYTMRWTEQTTGNRVKLTTFGWLYLKDQLLREVEFYANQ